MRTRSVARMTEPSRATPPSFKFEKVLLKLPSAHTTLWSLWLYLGGPLVWGVWMVWKLRLITVEDFYLCLWPAGAAILFVLLALHSLNLSIRSRHALLRHFVLLAVFGTAGTFGFLTLGGAFGLHLSGGMGREWLAQATRGALVGASMIALFYPLPTTELFKSTCRGKAAASRLRRWNIFSWLVGVPTWLVSNLIGRPLPPSLWAMLQTLTPVVMSGLLLLRLSRSPAKESA